MQSEQLKNPFKKEYGFFALLRMTNYFSLSRKKILEGFPLL